VLVQTLGIYQNSEALGAISTNKDNIYLTLAGYTSREALCCPTLISKVQWRWVSAGAKFVMV